jgi:hypothetical protein
MYLVCESDKHWVNFTDHTLPQKASYNTSEYLFHSKNSTALNEAGLWLGIILALLRFFIKAKINYGLLSMQLVLTSIFIFT